MHPTTPVFVILPARIPSIYAASSILKVTDATFSDDPLPEVTMKYVFGNDFPTFRAASVYSKPCAKTTPNPRDAKSRNASSKSAGEVVCTIEVSAPSVFLISCKPSKAAAFHPPSLTGPGVSNAQLKVSFDGDAASWWLPPATLTKIAATRTSEQDLGSILIAGVLSFGRLKH